MARMKGNRGTKGFQQPPIDLPMAFGNEPPGGGRRMRWWPAIVAALVLAVIVAGGVALALRTDDDVATADPTEPATPAQAVTLTPTPAPTTPQTATNTVAAPTPTQTAASRTASATATQATTVAPTAPPTVAATPTPSGPPLVRTRYVVQPGDGCEVIRMKFKFANADFEEFPVAMGTLSGRSAANRCVMNTGDVLCVPTQSDLGQLTALKKDEACLAGP